jgi:hypothetical protein
MILIHVKNGYSESISILLWLLVTTGLGSTSLASYVDDTLVKIKAKSDRCFMSNFNNNHKQNWTAGLMIYHLSAAH